MTMSMAHTAHVSPELRMLRLASGPVAAQAIYVFAALGIPDILRERAKSAAEIAGEVHANNEILHRVLRFLATIDIVTEDTQGRFALTVLGKTLCSRPISVIRDNTLLMGSQYYWAAIGDLLHQVKTGDNAFQHAMGQTFFTYLSEHSDEANVFNAAMNSSSQLGVSSILAMYDFSSFRKIVDVAGGKGALLTGILKGNPTVHAVLFDSPSVLEHVRIDPAVADRFSKVPGSFFEGVPTGGDAYILRRILHDWDDEHAAAILQQCRKAISKNGKLLIIELAPPLPGEPGSDWATMDVFMMLLMNGRERTETDFKVLLGDTGFQLNRIVRGNSPYWIVEAVPV